MYSARFKFVQRPPLDSTAPFGFLIPVSMPVLKRTAFGLTGEYDKPDTYITHRINVSCPQQ